MENIPNKGLRKRTRKTDERYIPGPDYDESLPYGGKVYLARRKKPDSWFVIGFEVLVILLLCLLCYYTYFHYDEFHFHVNHFYARIGHTHAQHIVGQKYLEGHGVERNHTAAFEWFKEAAKQGHPEASYNLAIGHLEGLHEHLSPGEAHGLIKHAAKHGVPEAKDVLENICPRGDCDI